MTARAIGARISAPAPIAKASGSMPKIMASVVMTIGRRRVEPAWISASSRGSARGAGLVREVDEQDRVLRHQAHQHDEADHAHHVERVAGGEEREGDADQRERQREHDRQRVDERSELRGEDQVDEDDRRGRGSGACS